MSTLWPKFLDEMIAGLPVNSQQRLKIGQLKERIQALEQENEELKSEIEKIRTELSSLRPNIAAETVKVLKTIFDQGEAEFTVALITFALDLETSVARYHVDQLRKFGFVIPSRALRSGVQPEFRITEDGRAFIVENHLV